MPIHTSSLG